VSSLSTKNKISHNSYALTGHQESTVNTKYQTVNVHTYDNGARYEGEWENGRKHGKGTYYYANGNKYNGVWVNDKRTGHGVYIYTNGDRYEVRCSQITCHHAFQ
jgi:hypothetical protein